MNGEFLYVLTLIMIGIKITWRFFLMRSVSVGLNKNLSECLIITKG